MEKLTGEILDINNEFGSYQEFKASLDADFQEAAEKFVVIGYKLKLAKDTDILRESGYRDVWEFAEAEYCLDKSQASRYININDKFAENGYSKRLRKEYRGFGVAKLAIMLTLPEAVNEELTADYTKAEIRMVKSEIDEEKKRTDIEVMLEDKDNRQQGYGIFGKILYQLCHDEPDLYLKLYATVMDTVYDGSAGPVIDRLMDALAPAGEGIRTVRISGEGRKMLSIKGAEAMPAVIDVRSGTKETCTWTELINNMESLCGEDDAEKNWEKLYGEEFPGEEKVAPVQLGLDAESEKKTEKKQRRVTRAKVQTEEKEKKGCERKDSRTNVDEDMEKQQMEEKTVDAAGSGTFDVNENETEPRDNEAAADIGAEKTGMVAGVGTEDVLAAGETIAVPDTAEIEGEQMDITQYEEYMPEQKCDHDMVTGYLDALRDILNNIYSKAEQMQYSYAVDLLEAARGTLRKIMEVSGQNEEHNA